MQHFGKAGRRVLQCFSGGSQYNLQRWGADAPMGRMSHFGSEGMRDNRKVAASRDALKSVRRPPGRAANNIQDAITAHNHSHRCNHSGWSGRVDAQHLSVRPASRVPHCELIDASDIVMHPRDVAAWLTRDVAA